ncbi:hypothetical protein [Sulfurimonas sp.]
MYESQIVEVEDMNFCHYINHFDEQENSHLTYEEIFELDGVSSDYNEDEEYNQY